MTKRSWFLLALVVFTASYSACRSSPIQAPARTDSFLDKHWARSVGPQGSAPESLVGHGITLDAQSCSKCHVEQFNTWKNSLHANAMGPGVLGQLIEMAPHALKDHQSCISCHAPLYEQAQSLVVALEKKARDSRFHEPALHQQGVSCAACHVREYQWYGPPRRDGSMVATDSKDLAAQFPHNAWQSSLAFEDSKFCASCHQFEKAKDDPSINGKLLENTYEEWRESRFAREGITCQKCHMPDRKHLWRGIHDPETVRQGVVVNTTPVKIESGKVIASLTLESKEIGHRFPTYVTPRVLLEIFQESSDGRSGWREIKGTLKRFIIGREVTIDIQTEVADTRLAPGEKVTLEYREKLKKNARNLVLRVRVEPDEFYTRFYQALLSQGMAKKGKGLIRQALKNSLESHYELYFKRQPLLPADQAPGPG